MLLTIRRFRSQLIRLGFGAIKVGLLVAVAVLVPLVLIATTSPDLDSSSIDRNTLDSSVPLDVAEVSVSSSGDALGTAERAREQLASVVNTQVTDWTALDYAIPFETTDLLPTTLDGIYDLALMAAINPTAADWLPLATEASQLARADAMTPAGFAGVMPGSGGGGGLSGGGGGLSGGASGGGSIGAGGGIGSASGSAGISGSREAFDVNSTLMALGVNHGGNHDVRGEQAAKNGRSFERDGQNRHSKNGNGNPNGARGRSGEGAVGPNGGRDVISVPEPSTLLLMAAGLSSLTLSRLRRRAGR